MRTLTHSHASLIVDAEAPPALVVGSGESVVVETVDCFGNRITSADQVFRSEEELLAYIGGFNPVTGPIAVEGAEPGDVLIVTIDAIRLGARAPFAVHVSNHKDIAGRPTELRINEPVTRICPIDGDIVTLPLKSGPVSIPVRPMVGSILTAPPSGTRDPLFYDDDTVGNIDCPDLGVGAKIWLPVHRPGGLVFLGDVHAAMGDAEITGTALETSGDVTIRIDVVKPVDLPARMTAPWLDTRQSIGTVGCQPHAGLEENLNTAFVAMLHRLTAGAMLSTTDAHHLLGAAARVTINQCVSTKWKAVRVSLPNRLAHAIEREDRDAPTKT